MKTSRQFHEAAILDALPGTQSEIRERTGLAQSSISRAMGGLRLRNLVHVCSWIRNTGGGSFVMVYGAGPGADAEPLVPLTAIERLRRSRGKARLEKQTVREKRAPKASGGSPGRDPLFALFGRT